MSKIYAIVFPFQQAQIDAWCWGECGKGHIGALDLGVTMAIGCSEEECPHLDKQLDEPMGVDSHGSDVYVRKLKEVSK